LYDYRAYQALETLGWAYSSLRPWNSNYLRDESPDCSLIRLLEFDQSEAQRLRQLVKSLVTGDRQEVALQNEEWVKPVEGVLLKPAGVLILINVGGETHEVGDLRSGITFRACARADGGSANSSR
jgi:hypothetical protein